MQSVQKPCSFSGKRLTSFRKSAATNNVNSTSIHLVKPKVLVKCALSNHVGAHSRFSVDANLAAKHLTESNSLLNPHANAVFNSVSYTPALTSVVLKASQNFHTWKFGQNLIEAIQVTHATWSPALVTPWTPANCVVASQVATFQPFDRPAFGSGQGLGYVLVATGFYICMLVSSLIFGKVRKFPMRHQRRSRSRRTLRTARKSFATSVRPYIMQLPVKMSQVLMQRDPPSRLQRYPAKRIRGGLRVVSRR